MSVIGLLVQNPNLFTTKFVLARVDLGAMLARVCEGRREGKERKKKTKLYINNTNTRFQKFMLQAGGDIVDWQQFSSQL
jgi:hypothetical protein